MLVIRRLQSEARKHVVERERLCARINVLDDELQVANAKLREWEAACEQSDDDIDREGSNNNSGDDLSLLPSSSAIPPTSASPFSNSAFPLHAPPTPVTPETHEQSVSTAQTPEDDNFSIPTPQCPRCRTDMLAKRSRSTGTLYWGCRSFPRCTETMGITIGGMTLLTAPATTEVLDPTSMADEQDDPYEFP